MRRLNYVTSRNLYVSTGGNGDYGDANNVNSNGGDGDIKWGCDDVYLATQQQNTAKTWLCKFKMHVTCAAKSIGEDNYT